jgi:RNA-binding protein 8A
MLSLSMRQWPKLKPQAAIDGASDTLLLDQTIHCDYAFVRPPPSGPKNGRPA